MVARLYAADAQFIQVERAYAGRLLREGLSASDEDWPEGVALDTVSDDRWEMEEKANESGDEDAAAFVHWRRRRDGIN